MKLSWYLRKKKLTLRNPIFRGKLLVSLASFIQESGWEFFRELATSIGGHSVFSSKTSGIENDVNDKSARAAAHSGTILQKSAKKMKLIDYKYCCMQQFAKFWVWTEWSETENMLKLTWQHSWNYFCWTHFWWVLAIWNQCAARLGVDVHIFYMNTVLFSCTYVGQPHPHHYPGKRRALHRNSLHDPVKG